MRISRRTFQLACGGYLLPKLPAQTPATGQKRVLPGAAPAPDSAAANAPAAVSTQNARRRLALLIGNNGYRKAPALGNAVNDSEDLGNKLTQLGFIVTKIRDAGLAATRAAVADFKSRLGPGDAALLFYSGHGLQVGGENYIVPVDFDPTLGESHVATGCLRASEARDMMEKSGSQLNIVILDSCRDNPFRTGAVKGMALMEAGLGTCIVLATGPGQTASDNPGERNGLFSKYLIQDIGRPGQSLDALLKGVKEQVFKASEGKQRPWTFADMIGDFYFGTASPSFNPSGQARDMVEAGKMQLQTGKFEEAAQSFDRAIRIDPENPYCYNALGSARARLQQFSIAVGFYAKAIELKPDYAAAYFNRGVAYFNAARYELAVQDFTWAVDEEPYDPRALDLRGKTYLQLRDNENALADFNHAFELDPSDSTALAGRGKVYFRQGKYPDAIRELTASINLHPAADALDARSQSYRALRQTAQADEDARRADQLRSQR